MAEHRLAILIGFPVTLPEAVAYEASGTYVDPDTVPDDLLKREPEYGTVGCLDCSKVFGELGEAPCDGRTE